MAPKRPRTPSCELFTRREKYPSDENNNAMEESEPSEPSRKKLRCQSPTGVDHKEAALPHEQGMRKTEGCEKKLGELKMLEAQWSPIRSEYDAKATRVDSIDQKSKPTVEEHLRKRASLVLASSAPPSKDAEIRALRSKRPTNIQMFAHRPDSLDEATIHTSTPKSSLWLEKTTRYEEELRHAREVLESIDEDLKADEEWISKVKKLVEDAKLAQEENKVTVESQHPNLFVASSSKLADKRSRDSDSLTTFEDSLDSTPAAKKKSILDVLKGYEEVPAGGSPFAIDSSSNNNTTTTTTSADYLTDSLDVLVKVGIGKSASTAGNDELSLVNRSSTLHPSDREEGHLLLHCTQAVAAPGNADIQHQATLTTPQSSRCHAPLDFASKNQVETSEVACKQQVGILDDREILAFAFANAGPSPTANRVVVQPVCPDEASDPDTPESPRKYSVL